jgi:hypothetical protein
MIECKHEMTSQVLCGYESGGYEFKCDFCSICCCTQREIDLMKERDELKSETIWEEHYDGEWQCSKCDALWMFEDGGPVENRVNYCQGCGAKIKEIKHYDDEELE